MRENAKDIAQRVKGLRVELGVSPEEMAQHVQVTPDRYESYEAAREDIPASVLTEIAAKLNVDLGLLLTGTAPKMSQFSVTRRSRGISVRRRQGYSYENLAATFKDAKFEPFIVTLPITGPDDPVPQNAHPGHEFHYILVGSVHLKVGDNEMILHEGDSTIFDASLPHGLKTVDGPATLLAVITV